MSLSTSPLPQHWALRGYYRPEPDEAKLLYMPILLPHPNLGLAVERNIKYLMESQWLPILIF